MCQRAIVLLEILTHYVGDSGLSVWQSSETLGRRLRMRLANIEMLLDARGSTTARVIRFGHVFNMAMVPFAIAVDGENHTR